MTAAETLSILSPAASAATFRAMSLVGMASGAVDLVAARRFDDADEVSTDVHVEIHHILGALAPLSTEERRVALGMVARAQIMIGLVDEAISTDFLARVEARRN
jgi:hypothetical protein